MANAIHTNKIYDYIKYAKPNKLHIKYPQFTHYGTLTLLDDNNTHHTYTQKHTYTKKNTTISKHNPRISVVKLHIVLKSNIIQYYINNNIFKYLDNTWHGKSHSIMLRHPGQTLLANNGLSIQQLIQKCLLHNVHTHTHTHTHTHKAASSLCWHTTPKFHRNIIGCNNTLDTTKIKEYMSESISTTSSNYNNNIFYYINLHEFVYNLDTHIKCWNGKHIILHTIPCWSIGLWIEIITNTNTNTNIPSATTTQLSPKKHNVGNVSKKQYISVINSTLSHLGISLASYYSMKYTNVHDSEFYEMLELLAFNHCYTLAKDINLSISPRYINKYGGLQEFIITNNRFIADLYPPIPNIVNPNHNPNPIPYIKTKANLAKKLMITNIGIYSITRSWDTKNIVNEIKKECSNLFGNKKSISHITITDSTAGVGGDTIAFALAGFKVNACEIIPEHCQVITNNIAVYGLDNNVNVICGDYTQKYLTIQQDIIYIDPPWGGVGYEIDYNNLYLFGKTQKFMDFIDNIISHKIAKLVVLKVPMQFDTKQLTNVLKLGNVSHASHTKKRNHSNNISKKSRSHTHTKHNKHNKFVSIVRHVIIQRIKLILIQL